MVNIDTARCAPETYLTHVLVLLLTDGISLASVGLKLTAAVLLLPFYIETCTIQCFVLASTKRSKVDFFSLVVHLLIIFLNTGPLFGKLMSIF